MGGDRRPRDLACRGAPRSVALVGTYPPTECGLATFTSNLRAAIACPPWGWRAKALRVLDRPEPAPSDEVVEQWVAGDPESLRRSLVALNGFDAVLLQHEYGLFGGRDGEQVLDLIHGLEVPVLTWGLLSPGKGIEHGIAAIARLGIHSPAISYIVAGETHPKVRAVQGEQYRNSLKAHALALGVADHVRFDDAYRDWKSLAALVRTVDVVLLPYDSRDQVSSGVLVEALASGKPVIATRFPHAVELLADGAGILVDHGDVEGIAHALERVLYERDLAGRMASAARVAATPLLWPAVGASYRSLVNSVVAQRAATTSVSPCSIRVMPADSMGSDDTG